MSFWINCNLKFPDKATQSWYIYIYIYYIEGYVKQRKYENVFFYLIYIYNSGVGINKNYIFHNFKFHVCLRSSGK